MPDSKPDSNPPAPLDSLLETLGLLITQAQVYERVLPPDNYPARAAVAVLGELARQALNEARTLAETVAPSPTPEHPFSPREFEVLALAAAVEQGSAHPLAKAVIAAAQTRGVAGRYAAQDVAALAGRGVQGDIAGKRVTIGNHALFEAEHPHDVVLCAWVDAAEHDGQTAMLLCDGDRVRGYLAVADAPRPESAAMLRELHGQGVKTVMLTGDNAAVAASVASHLGMDDVRANLLPADKLEAVRGLLREHGAVAMVGDGVNDAPALAAATVGIAMGGAGSAQALETADVALMADDLRQLPYALRLSRFARALIRQNIAVSLAFKLAVVLLALVGMGSLWLAVLADVGMSLAVTLNGMRPLRQK